jgi:hypothetical protein
MSSVLCNETHPSYTICRDQKNPVLIVDDMPARTSAFTLQDAVQQQPFLQRPSLETFRPSSGTGGLSTNAFLEKLDAGRHPTDVIRIFHRYVRHGPIPPRAVAQCAIHSSNRIHGLPIAEDRCSAMEANGGPLASHMFSVPLIHGATARDTGGSGATLDLAGILPHPSVRYARLQRVPRSTVVLTRE